jgi:hypothetical protein
MADNDKWNVQEPSPQSFDQLREGEDFYPTKEIGTQEGLINEERQNIQESERLC